jgi:hypothetical protein
MTLLAAIAENALDLNHFTRKKVAMNRNLDTDLGIFRVIGEALFLYGLLGWIYGVLIQITHPEFLGTYLSHLTPWIRVDTFSVMSFIISIIGFFIWRLTKQTAKQH